MLGTFRLLRPASGRAHSATAPSTDRWLSDAISLVTAPLRRELARVLPYRPFQIRFWDGTVALADEATASHADTTAIAASAARTSLLLVRYIPPPRASLLL